jgi:hypothetical protein
MKGSKIEMEGLRDIMVISKAIFYFSKEERVSDACVTSCDFIKTSS